MAKLVFKPIQIADLQEEVEIQLPDKYKKFHKTDEQEDFEIDQEGNIIEQYQGPSIEEIEAELQRYRQETEEQVRQLLEDAKNKPKPLKKKEGPKPSSYNFV